MEKENQDDEKILDLTESGYDKIKIQETPIIDLTKTHDKNEIEKGYQELKKHKKIVVTSGYFDPLHHGHIELFKKSKELGDHLIVLLNTDIQTKMKKGYVFMPHEERAKIIAEMGCVDEVFISIDEDNVGSVDSLDVIRPHIYTKGGDRYESEIPETPICKKHGIQIIDGVGAKLASSSELVEKEQKAKKELEEEN